MILKTNCCLALLLIFLISGCKSDNTKETETPENLQTTKNISESDKLLQHITRAHNIWKFKEEAQVKFKAKLKTTDSIFFDGFITLKTDGSKARFLDSNVDKVIYANDLNSELDQQLYWIIESYALAFWMNSDKFKKVADSDDIVTSEYESAITSSNYTIYTHPLTDIIQGFDYQTKIKSGPFGSGKLIYDKYITVNRVPVALKWELLQKDEVVANAEISRISYPEQF